MLQNLWWATGYNVVGIPLAAGVLFGAGILLPPALARGVHVGLDDRRGAQRATAASHPLPR